MITKMNSPENLLNILPNDDILSKCIHCGLCLTSCPTYEMTKLERSSPRGRIKLIKSVARKEMPVTETFAYEMNFCLDCQACMTACPAGVQYGTMVESARVLVSKSQFGSFWEKKIKRFALDKILGSRKNLKLFAKLLYFYQNYGLQKLLHSSGLFKLIPKKFSEIDEMAPKASKISSDKIIPEITLPKGEEKYKTAMLTGCLMNVMFADINKDTVDVLAACGSRVFTPKNQICCGSLSAHNGEIESAKRLAKKTIDAFEKEDYDFLISNSAGCGAFMKEYGHLFENDKVYSEKAKKLSERVKDLTEFLAENEPEISFKKIDEPVTYHDACHLVHTQKIFSEPRKVLKSIPGLNIKNLEESTWCCGSAGIYNIVQFDSSMKVLERKMKNIKKTNAKIVVTGNPGCIGQIKYGAKKFNVDVEVIHPATLIKRALK